MIDNCASRCEAESNHGLGACAEKATFSLLHVGLGSKRVVLHENVNTNDTKVFYRRRRKQTSETCVTKCKGASRPPHPRDDQTHPSSIIHGHAHAGCAPTVQD